MISIALTEQEHNEGITIEIIGGYLRNTLENLIPYIVDEEYNIYFLNNESHTLYPRGKLTKGARERYEAVDYYETWVYNSEKLTNVDESELHNLLGRESYKFIRYELKPFTRESLDWDSNDLYWAKKRNENLNPYMMEICDTCGQSFPKTDGTIICLACLNNEYRNINDGILRYINSGQLKEERVVGGYWHKIKGEWQKPRIFTRAQQCTRCSLIDNIFNKAYFWQPRGLAKEKYDEAEDHGIFTYKNMKFKKMTLDEAQSIVRGKVYLHGIII